MTSGQRFISWPNSSCGWAPEVNISKDSRKATENVCITVGRWNVLPARSTIPLTSVAQGNKNLQMFLLCCLHCPLSAVSFHCWFLLTGSSQRREAGSALLLGHFWASLTPTQWVWAAGLLKTSHTHGDHPDHNQQIPFLPWHVPFPPKHPASWGSPVSTREMAEPLLILTLCSTRKPGLQLLNCCCFLLAFLFTTYESLYSSVVVCLIADYLSQAT